MTEIKSCKLRSGNTEWSDNWSNSDMFAVSVIFRRLKNLCYIADIKVRAIIDLVSQNLDSLNYYLFEEFHPNYKSSYEKDSPKKYN